jgi:hypothetical protein
MGNQMAKSIAHPPHKPAHLKYIGDRVKQERGDRTTSPHQFFRRAIAVQKSAIATPSYNGSIEVAARSTLWQFDNPDTAKKSSPSAATLSMSQKCALKSKKATMEE